MSADSTEPPQPQPLRSKHTANFPALLEELGASVLVTTYQAGKLVVWMLESGKGGLGFVNLSTGRYECVAELSGFTRGLDVFSNLAFVGLSQVRESAVFSGIPIAERALAERNCGVWVVYMRAGRTVAFLRFEDAVQEVFAVQVLPGLRYPELAPEEPKLLADSYDLPSAALEQAPRTYARRRRWHRNVNQRPYPAFFRPP